MKRAGRLDELRDGMEQAEKKASVSDSVANDQGVIEEGRTSPTPKEPPHRDQATPLRPPSAHLSRAAGRSRPVSAGGGRSLAGSARLGRPASACSNVSSRPTSAAFGRQLHPT